MWNGICSSSRRDGSAVEIVGLCKSTVSWLNGLYNHGKYPYEGVKIKGRWLSSVFSFVINFPLYQHFCHVLLLPGALLLLP